MALVPTGLTTDTVPVSLSRFTPRIENLPASCLVAYNAPIEGCTKDDFPKNRDENINNCSADCVNGLLKIVELVNQNCMTVRVPADSIIGVALLGNLLPQLCGKIVVVTEQPSSTQAPALQTSSTSSEASTTQEAQSSSAQQAQSSSSSQTTESASSASTTSAANTPNQSIELAPPNASGGLTLDTASPPPVPSQTAIGQKSNPDSGGGSPFDVQFASTTSRLWIGSSTMTAILGVAAYFVLFL
ncbi:hypothetical protein N0V90_001199 [Kalmusia sp. IMI 367209]|nr:hypothetical protein N0V90_001199 [Kalmusia sp. IMI 367209]